MSKSWRFLAVAATASVAVLTTFASAALADAPKFHAATSSVSNTGAFVVSFDERGLGNTNIDYTLRADATATYACINGGGNHPQAANKETVNGAVSASGSFEPKNGRVVASLSGGAASARAASRPPGPPPGGAPAPRRPPPPAAGARERHPRTPTPTRFL